jgi:AraC-like DNA-binding protein
MRPAPADRPWPVLRLSLMSPLLDPFVRGLAVGALLVTGLAIWRSGVGRSHRLASLLGCLSIAAWAITESPSMWGALGYFFPILLLAYPVAASFWLMIGAMFEDMPVNALTLTPAAVLIVSGVAMTFSSPPLGQWIWAGRNLAGVLFLAHAGFIILRGWRGDLIESRRRLRAVVLGFAAIFSVAEVVLAFVYKIDPKGPWMLLAVGGLYGGLIVAAIALVSGVLFLQGRASLFGVARRPEATADPRAETADRQLMGKLDAFMAAGGWRKEGLTIGAVAAELATPEHRLRRLINQRLGHRNFADFVNGHRISAAKRRLADPAEARTTVAAIAFELGYGSLGPFNRAFRAVTGVTPTVWRRQALSASPDLQEAI